MKTTYKWYDVIPNSLLGSAILGILISLSIFYFFPQFELVGNILEAIVTGLALLTIIFGICNSIAGIIFIIGGRKEAQKRAFGKQLLLKGLGRVIIILFLFFGQSFALSFFGRS